MKYLAVSTLLVLLFTLTSKQAEAQSAACNKHCGQFDWDCKQREANCETKLGLYKTYMAQIGAGVTLFSLPQRYIDLLRPHYPAVDLTRIRFGFSPRQLSIAITDCDTIYFTNGSFVNNVRNGTLSKDNGDDFNLLYHELTHTEQCAQRGGRDAYAVMWWEDLDLTVARNPDPLTIHRRQPMETEARTRAVIVDNALPDGLVQPVSISSLTSNVAMPQPVHNLITWTTQASGGRGAIQFSFEVRRARRSTIIAQQPFGNNNTFQFVPTEQGDYTVRALARQASPLRLATQLETTFTVAGAGGGSGGVPFSSICPRKSVMMGFSVRTGWYLDAVQPFCMGVNPDGTWFRHPPGPFGYLRILHVPDDAQFFEVFPGGYFLNRGTRAGGEGGTLTGFGCTELSARSGITSLFGRSGALIDSLGIRCGTLGQVGSGVGIIGNGQSYGPLGGSGGRPFELRCPFGQVATGITGRADKFINHIALVCGNPTP